MPVISGMFQSTSTRSGSRPSASSASAARPSPASATSKPSWPNVRFRMMRIVRESSTTRACTADLLVVGRGAGHGGVDVELQHEAALEDVDTGDVRAERRIGVGRDVGGGGAVDVDDVALAVDDGADGA